MKRALVIATLFLLIPQGAFAARSLSLGMSGTDVKALQTALISKGYLAAGKNTGTFGAMTQTALQKFQCAQKIACGGMTTGYGVYGPKTQVALANSIASTNASRAKDLEFSGWIPYWRTATGTKDVLPHLAQLSSVMPFGYTMHNDGTLADTAHLTEEPWVSFIAEAKKQGVKVVPSVMWGNGDNIHRILSNTKTRIALEDEIAKVVKDNNFDGIDIDFEAKKHETMEYFSLFLKGLYQRMGKKLVYCTIEARMPITDRYLEGQTVPADAMDYANDYKALNKYCDRVEIMAYDQGVIARRLNKARMAPYAPVADPAWVESLVTLAMKDIDKKKIIIGVATYGYEYEVTPIPGDGYKYKVLWPFNPKYATDIAAKLGIAPARNSAGEMGFSYDPRLLAAVAPTNGQVTQTQQQVSTATVIAENAGSSSDNQPFNYFSWSDAQAIADKVALARELGVRGVAVFKFDGGEDQKIWEVLR
ncbi:MAG: glycosyl hydrolase family 18 protein [Candidatus Pacebacteria bacterium]|jgi:spore germination protein YaaH|nr:glycosyl hydrolase family 18 protein [Candidatus Paceibacterota bacterium]